MRDQGADEPIVLTNATIVAGDRVVDRGSVVVHDGFIEAVEERCYAIAPGTLDLGGRLLLPGIVDLHNDALEMEIVPRPGAQMDPSFALLHLDRKLAAAGVTTQFHAIAFAERPDTGRSVAYAEALSGAVRAFQETGDRAIEHAVLHRLDVRTPGAFESLVAALDRAPIAFVSLNDHVPGRGQFKNVDDYRQYVRRYLRPDASAEELEAVVGERLDHAARTQAIVESTLRRLSCEARGRPMILASHDDDTPERVDQMRELGCTIAEFPLNAATADRARERGMVIAMGAPNALRGRSLTGNASALEFLARGRVDMLVADYAATTLLAAAFRIVDVGLADLPSAMALVARNPAMAAGMADRGVIVPGHRADLIAVHRSDGWASVAATFVQGRLRYAGGQLAERLTAT